MFTPLRAAIVLAIVWAIVGGAVYWAKHATPTAESVTALMAGGPANLSRVETQLNLLPYDQRQKLQRKRVTRDFFQKLGSAEKTAFLDATLPAGFKQMMEAFNKMDPVKRKAFVARALSEMQKHEGDEHPHSFENDPMAQRVVDQGLRSFYSDANADTKLDLAPLIEQMQRNLRRNVGGDQ